jgi:alkyl sulfatase BDS1-like metallo-beta-lactamase superfamily hydrolase
MEIYRPVAVMLFCATLLACDGKVVPVEEGADARGHTAPTATTIAANRAVLQALPFADDQDFIDARQGFIASPDTIAVAGPTGELIWDTGSYGFIQGDAPASANPSLWRQEQLNNIHGLFEVTPGIHQLRGFDLANMTLIDSDNGWIVVDPLTARETAATAMAFARAQLGDKPVTAIVFTHSHVDHFGGVEGVIDRGPNGSLPVPVIAPAGFMAAATSENMIAGPTMGRRSVYMYGKELARSPRGHIGTGLGKGPAYGSVSIAKPSLLVAQTPQQMTIDGVDFVFQYTPDSEAPAELTFFLPAFNAFCGAEVVSRNMHNLYTLRGARVRDALKWSGYIDQAIEMFSDADIYFGSHHWPLWGNERIIDFLEKQRDTYKYIHDQTLRLAAQGLTPGEIADQLQMPASLARSFSSRGYYGTVKHNARAVYQAYFGWYDGNPANLDPLPPPAAAVRYIELMGGADVVLTRAREAFDRGEYRWVAELLNHLVFARPDNVPARGLLAGTYDQLAYRAESGPWRDVYLTGAHELRHGTPQAGVRVASAAGLLGQTPVGYFFDTMAVMLDGPQAAGKEMTINITFTDLGETHVLSLKNAVLHHRQRPADPDANASITLTHELFVRMLTGQAGLRETLFSDELALAGSKVDALRFFSLLEQPDYKFNIVTP